MSELFRVFAGKGAAAFTPKRKPPGANGRAESFA
jgi:hypothetical protein